MRVLIWDFDGVVADTVKECYLITLAVIAREKEALSHEAEKGDFKPISFEDFEVYRSKSVNAADFFANFLLHQTEREMNDENLEDVTRKHLSFLKKMDEIFYEEREKLMLENKDEYFSTIKLYGGVASTINSISEKGIKQVIMSARDSKSIDQILGHFHLRKPFDLIIGHEVNKGDRHVKGLQIKLLKEHFAGKHPEGLQYYFIDDIPFNLKKLEGFAKLLFAEWGYGELKENYVDASRIKTPPDLEAFFNIN